MKFQTEDWGLIGYQEAYARQKAIVEGVMNGEPDRLIICEHPAVLTLGRMTHPDSLLYTRENILAQGIEIYPIDRGGDVTLHAPGQLIVYPIINLSQHGKDLKKYMQVLEQVAVDLLNSFGILAESIEGKRGVFTANRKIVSIGVGVRKWVSFHGLGINVSTDLALFRFIKPCGLDVMMTTMARELGKNVEMKDVKAGIVRLFEQVDF